MMWKIIHIMKNIKKLLTIEKNCCTILVINLKGGVKKKTIQKPVKNGCY